jgi:predicted ATP-grasp superfamily ATP-dependent carboligase
VRHIRWEERPSLRDPVFVAAFAGWNDAGDAATGAVRYLVDRYDATEFAHVDPEDFFDFTAARPHVSLGDDGHRELTWPTTEFHALTLPTGRDAVLVVGTEPHLRWRTFGEQIVGMAQDMGCSLFVTLGAMVAEVPHSRPVRVVGNVTDPALRTQLDLPASTYEGPTGIVGVVTAACTEAEMATVSLWASVPTYVPAAPSPKAALALVEQTGQVLGTWFPTTELEIASASYERQVSELVAEDEETADYVRSLEDSHDSDVEPSGRSLVEEVERYLRDRPD